jgi:hypothetical protein
MSQPPCAAMFDFSQPDQRRPATLSQQPMPRIGGAVVRKGQPSTRERVNKALQEGCDCKLMAAPTATLRRRMIQGGVNIWLQCDGCGRALSNAMPRADHFDADRYPEWDEELPRAYAAAQQAFWSEQRQAIPSPELRREQRIQDHLAKSLEYETFLRTSPEWAAVRKKVLERSRGWCEACLGQSAGYVHHLTYQHGKIPPAWALRAVCRTCHERLHTAGDDWCDPGMDR